MQRLSSEEGARKILHRLVSADLCKIEDLDTPPQHHLNPSSYRNLLRDPDTSEAVQPINPRDLIKSSAGPDFLPRDSSLLLPRTLGEPLDHESGQHHESGADGPNHEFAF